GRAGQRRAKLERGGAWRAQRAIGGDARRRAPGKTDHGRRGGSIAFRWRRDVLVVHRRHPIIVRRVGTQVGVVIVDLVGREVGDLGVRVAWVRLAFDSVTFFVLVAIRPGQTDFSLGQ